MIPPRPGHGPPVAGDTPDDDAVVRSAGLGTRTVHGVFWAYGSYVGGRVLVLVSIAILARLLTPRDFGLVALALAFTALLETVRDFGLSQALVVSKREDVGGHADSVFVWGLVIAGAGACLTVAVSPLVARFFDEPQVVPLLSVLALNFPLRALGATHYALAQRSMNFRARTAAELSNVATRGVVGVTLALLGFGAWSLVIGFLAGTVVLTTMLWVMVPWRPRLRASRAHTRELFTFGGTLTGVDVMHGIATSADSIIIGRVLGPTALGLYSLGQRLPQLLVVNLSVVAGSVLFPAFSKVEPQRLGTVFLTVLRFTAIIAAPLAAGLIVLGEPVILAVFGDQWGGAVGTMQVMAVYGVLLTLEIPGGTVFKVTGRASILLKLALPRTVMLYVTVALFASRGITAVAICIACVTAVFAAIALTVASRVIAVRPVAMLGAVWPGLVASAGMAVALLGVVHVLDGAWPTILAGVVVGAACYLGLLGLFARSSLEYLLRKTLPARARGRGA